MTDKRSASGRPATRRRAVSLVLPHLVAALALASSGNGQEISAGAAIVARSIEHHGGALFEASRVRLTQASRSGAFTMTVERHDGRYRYEVTGETSAGAERRAVATNDETSEWLDGARQPLDAERQARVRRFVDARVWFPFLPYGLQGDAVRLHDQGLERWGGLELHRVKATFVVGTSADADDEYVFWFDPDTARMRQYAYSFDDGDERIGLRFRPLSNFRRFDGLLFYDADNLGFEGGPDTSVDRIDPAFVSERMRPVSTIAVTDVVVERLTASDD